MKRGNVFISPSVITRLKFQLSIFVLVQKISKHVNEANIKTCVASSKINIVTDQSSHWLTQITVNTGVGQVYCLLCVFLEDPRKYGILINVVT